MKDIAVATLNYYHEKGLWVVVENEDGGYKISQVMLSDEQYNNALARLNELDENGYSEGDRQKLAEKRMIIQTHTFYPISD